MAVQQLAQMIGNWFYRSFRRKARVVPSRRRQTPRTRLSLEQFEDRLAPAGIPDPIASLPVTVAPFGATPTYSPVAANSPTNANKMVVVSLKDSTNGNNTDFVSEFSTNGGGTWTNFFGGGRDLDPNTPANNRRPYTRTTQQSVAFGRDGTVYLAFIEHDDSKNSGALVVDRFNFSGAFPTYLGRTLIYRWVGQDPALNPAIAVDNNLASFTDTNEFGQTVTQRDTTTGTVYLAWNTDAQHERAVQDAGLVSFWNRNIIEMVASPDRGTTWSSPVLVSDEGSDYFTGVSNGNTFFAASHPQLVFSQGTGSNPRPGLPTVDGGRMTIAWDQLTGGQQRGGFTTDSTTPDGATGGAAVSVLAAQGQTGTIGDNTTTPFTATFAPPPGFDVLTDLDVELTLIHPNLSELRAVLVPPAGSGLQPTTLWLNGVDAGGNTVNQGRSLSGADLSILNGVRLGVVFDQQAPRSITDQNNTAPLIMHYRPIDGDFNFGGLEQYNGVNGVTLQQLTGVWTLQLTDFRASGTPPPAQSVVNFTLRFTSRISNGMGTDNRVIPVGPEATLQGSFDDTNFPVKPPSSPNRGIGPNVVLASDNTLGAFSPFQGRIYLAYVGGSGGTGGAGFNTSIFLRTSDDGGLTWVDRGTINNDSPADNFSQGNRSQFMPVLTVDQATGTVVAGWFDARWDASNARVATFVGASLDGGDSFSQTFANEVKKSTDAITSDTINIEPIPSNFTANASKSNIGTRMSLLSTGSGHVLPIWTGNQNQNTVDPNDPTTSSATTIWKSNVSFAAGPRILSSDMGAVTAPASVSGSITITYNDQFAADGTRMLDGFSVTFDRPIDVSTFTIADIQAFYRSPTNPAGSPPVPVGIGSVTPVDGNLPLGFGPRRVGGNNTVATTFFVRFSSPQTATGTYSYEISPNLRDAIRRADANGNRIADGNLDDQNANGVTNQAGLTGTFGDVWAAPASGPNNRFPLQLPYDPNTLPLIIPGPHIVDIAVPNVPADPNLDDNRVVNGTVSAIDVTFDRDMKVISFTPAIVLRILGPVGLIPLNGITITPINPTAGGTLARTFRIGFPTQVLNGNYSVELDSFLNPQTGVGLVSSIGEGVDTNLNAGVDVLKGGNPTTGSLTNNTYNSGQVSIPLPPGVTTSVITVPDSFIIAQDQTFVQNPAQRHHIQLRLDITKQFDPDLKARLIAPDGTSIQLFTHVGTLGSSNSNFSNTIFDDFTTVPIPSPIQNGAAPFNVGPYSPQLPLSILADGTHGASGTWTLEITNDGGSAPGDALNNWSLILPEAVSGTGLGEPVADRMSLNFRIFLSDPTAALTHETWTPVGPAPIAGSRTARVTGIAVDPSDPSGNTVFVGGASGGVWKTTNFLTQDPAGPNWVPLTDFGPTNSLNIGGIAVFGRNHDPNQSLVVVATGEGDTGTPGVGMLISQDGGRTWKVADSTTNVDPQTGNWLPISSPDRDHKFVGTTAFKVLIDPHTDPSGGIFIYVAVGGGGPNDGVWRSRDGGNTWTLIRGGDATDIAFSNNITDAGSGLLTNLYAGFRGEGVYLTTAAPFAGNMSLLTGQEGNQLFRDEDSGGQAQIQFNTNPTPTGANGRIVLATPELTNNPLFNQLYEDWVYAVVVTAGGNLQGVYMSKDAGRNWTHVHIPIFLPNPTFPLVGSPSNNETLPDHDPLGAKPGAFGGGAHAQGNYDVALAIDPTNPRIIYIGGTNDGTPQTPGGPPGGMIRIDTTTLSDTQAVVAYDNSDNDGGSLQFTTSSGNAIVKPFNANPPLGIPRGPGLPYGFAGTTQTFTFTPPTNSGWFNLFRDPNNPFLANSTLLFDNVASIQNSGFDAKWEGFPAEVDTDVHRIFTMIDPLTGNSRLIVGDDQGIASFVDDNGNFSPGIGFSAFPSGDRNGNLQITQFYYGAAQPSTLAADIAGALFYGMAQDDGFPVSQANILQTGNLAWRGPGGDGTGVATDQTGSGTAYQFRWPCCGPDSPTDFFNTLQVNGNGGTYVSRTQGLLQAGDDPFAGSGQWPFIAGSNFAVHPRNGNILAISSQAGRIFLTTNQGVFWTPIGQPTGAGQLDGTYAPAIAFGAPDPANPGALTNLIYAGTSGGHVFVTENGGGTWRNISFNLDGSAVQVIQANPRNGSHELFAVTSNGIYHMADSRTSTQWDNITGNVFQLKNGVIFGDANEPDTILKPGGLKALAADWRFATPNNPNDPTAGTHPTLYVGGLGGVFRLRDWQTQTWSFFPDTTNEGAPVDGGYFPNVDVRDLDLVLGNISIGSGLPDQRSGLNMLVATTYGRGTFAIRLDTTLPPEAFVSGPAVVSVVNPGPTSGPTDKLVVTFDGPVEPMTFTPAKMQIIGPQGQVIPVTSIDDITTSGPLGNQHNVYRINFATQTAPGNYTIIIGPRISDSAGNLMNQNGNLTNGEDPDDRFVTTLFLNDAPPVIGPIANQVTNKNTPLVVHFTVTDATMPPDQLTYTATSTNQTIVPNTNFVFAGSGPNRVLVITPAANQTGPLTITIRVADTFGAFSTTQFQLKVNEPVVSNPPGTFTAPHGGSATGDVSTLFSDTDGPLSPPAFSINFRGQANGILANLPYALMSTLHLRALNGQLPYSQNAHGLNEKYFLSSTNQTYFMLPDGTLNLFTGLDASQHPQGTLVATLDHATWQEPVRLLGYDFEPLYQWQAFGTGSNPFAFNAAGGLEKWIKSHVGGVDTLFYLLPDGTLHQSSAATPQGPLNGPTVATFDFDTWRDPTLLLNDNQALISGFTVSLVGHNLTVTPPAGFAGTVVVYVGAFDGLATTYQTVQVVFPDTAPTVTVPDQTMTTGVNQIQVTVGATDPDTPPDTLQYSARVSGFDPGVEAALRLRLGTVPQSVQPTFPAAPDPDPSANDQFQVKFIFSYEQGIFYYIRANGELVNSVNNVVDSNIGTQYYQNPALLIFGPNGGPPAEPAPPPPAQLSVSPTSPSNSNVLTIDRQDGFTGVFIIETSVFDGFLTVKKRFKLTLQ
jgi:subtilisin-like proprotein convertase family protein